MRNTPKLLAFLAGAAVVCPAVSQPVEYEVIVASGQQAIGQPAGVTIRSFGSPLLDESGRVTYSARFNGSPFTGYVVYRTGEAEPQIIIQEGVTPPGFDSNNEVLGSIGSLDYGNHSGDLAFKANVNYLDSNPAPSLSATWTYSDDFGLRAVSLSGHRAPGTTAIMCSGGAYWYQYDLSNAGHVVIFNHLCGANAVSSRDEGIWASDENGQNLTLVVLESDPVPGFPGASFQFFRTPTINAMGTVVFKAFLNGTGVTNDNAFFAWNAQTGIYMLAREGEPVPGFPPTVTFEQIENVQVNDLGHTMIWGKIQGPGVTEDSDQIILCDRDGNGLEHVYREGIQAPQLTPGVKIGYISDVFFNNKSQIAFMSDMTGPVGVGEDGRYFWSEGGPPGLTPVVHTGQVVPGFDAPYALTNFRVYDVGVGYGPDPVFTDSGRLVFWGEVSDWPFPDPSDTHRRYYLSDAAGELRDILPPGTQLDVSNVPGSQDIRTVRSTSYRLKGSTNEADQVLAVTYFTDNTNAAVLVSYADSCLADVNGDGVVSPADFSAWVAAYNSLSPKCDQNGDQSCTPADFSAWVVNYNNGC